MTNIKTAQKYFELSNKSDFENIEKMFAETITYSSQNTGIYFGIADIIEMQKNFHGQFKSLQWTINSVDEIKPGVVLFDYNFTAEVANGEMISSSGLEYVIVGSGKIHHIEIRNK